MRGDDRSRHHVPELAEDVLGRDAHLSVAGRALEEVLRCLLVHDTRVDGAVVQLAECEHGRERKPAVAAVEGTGRQERKHECGDFLGERRVGFASEGCHLRALHGVDQPELRLDDTGLRLISAELGADGLVQVDEILNGQIANTAVSL